MRRLMQAALGLALSMGVLLGTGAEAIAEPAIQAAEVQGSDAPAAVVLRVQDAAEGSGPGALKVGAFLAAGQLLVPPPGGRIVVLLHDGEAVTIDGRLEIPSPTASADPLFRLLRALLIGSDDPRHLDLDEGGPDAEASGFSGRAVPVRPAGDRRVRTITPQLVWRSVEGAEGYRVQIWHAGDEVVSIETWADTTGTVPLESALNPGNTYTWAITPIPGSSPGPSVRFSIATREVLDNVARELGRLRARGLDPETDGLLPATALFRSMALPYDALALLEELRAAGDPWGTELEAFEQRLRIELADPGLDLDGPEQEGIR